MSMTVSSTLRAHGSALRNAPAAAAYCSTSWVACTRITSPIVPVSERETSPGRDLGHDVCDPRRRGECQHLAPRLTAPEQRQQEGRGQQGERGTHDSGGSQMPRREDDPDGGEHARLKGGRPGDVAEGEHVIV